MNKFKKTKLVDYGFVYHRDKYPLDDITWFLLQKKWKKLLIVKNVYIQIQNLIYLSTMKEFVLRVQITQIEKQLIGKVEKNYFTS